MSVQAAGVAKILAPIIAVTLLVDGLLHVAPVFLFFRGNFFADTLTVLFLLDFIAVTILALAALTSPRWLGARHWWVDIAILAYCLVAIVIWFAYGSPNPRGLGIASKVVEVIVIVLAAYHLKLTRFESLTH